jgi:hypothetical protein
MASHMTKLMRRLENAGIVPWFEVWKEKSTGIYKATVFGESQVFSDNTPETAIVRAVDDAVLNGRK